MKSRYIHNTRRTLPRKKRSKEVYGSFEDSHKFIKCWNCGFVIDRTKMKNGNILYTDVPVQSQKGEEWRNLCDSDAHSQGVLLIYKNDGTVETDYYTPRLAESYGGCPLCGTNNLP